MMFYSLGLKLERQCFWQPSDDTYFADSIILLLQKKWLFLQLKCPKLQLNPSELQLSDAKRLISIKKSHPK